MRVALDGPAGAGKSSVAKEVAKRCGYLYVDTGAMYRTIGYYCLKNHIDVHDSDKVVSALPQIQVETKYNSAGEQRMYLNGEDVSEAIRTPEGGMAASAVSALPQVRAFLLQTQRDMAKKYSVVMDGRDIGTVVLPSATVKIFITADSRVRAQRRYKELLQRGEEITYEKVLRDIQRRDYRDSHRRAAPLKQAEDAILLDTSDMDFDTAVKAVKDIIENKAGKD